MSENIALANLIISSISIFMIPLITAIVNCLSRVKKSHCCGTDIDLESQQKISNKDLLNKNQI